MMEEVGLSPFQNQHSPAVGVSPLDPNVDYYGCGSGLVPYTQSDSSGEDSEGQCDISFQLDDGDNGVFEEEEEDEEQHDTQEEEAEVDVTTHDEGDERPAAWVGRRAKAGDDEWVTYATYTGPEDGKFDEDRSAFKAAQRDAADTGPGSLASLMGMALKQDGLLVGGSPGISQDNKKLGRIRFWKCQMFNGIGSRGSKCLTQIRVVEHLHENKAQLQTKGVCNEHLNAPNLAKGWSAMQMKHIQASAMMGERAKECNIRFETAGLPRMWLPCENRKLNATLRRLEVKCVVHCMAMCVM